MTGVPTTTTAPAPSRRGFGAYGVMISALGAAVVCVLAVTSGGLPLGDWRFWLMAALVLVGELMPIDVPRRDGADRVALSTAFALGVLREFGIGHRPHRVRRADQAEGAAGPARRCWCIHARRDWIEPSPCTADVPAGGSRYSACGEITELQRCHSGGARPRRCN